MQPLLADVANTVYVGSFNARVTMVHLPSITFNCGCNCSLANVYIAHKLEASVLKTTKLMS